MKGVLSVLALLGILLVAGCTETDETQVTPKSTTSMQETTTSIQTTTSMIKCMPPQTVIGDACCIDDDSNDICDNQEQTDESGTDGIKTQDEAEVDCEGICLTGKLKAESVPALTASSYWIYEATLEEPEKEPEDYIYLYDYIGDVMTHGDQYYKFEYVPIKFTADNEIQKLSSSPMIDLYTISDNTMWKNMSTTNMKRIYQPARPYLKFPLRVGEEWSGQYEQRILYKDRKLGTLNAIDQVEVIAEEEISVPAGTFNTFMVRINSQISIGKSTKVVENITETLWYSPEVMSYVKQEKIVEVPGEKTKSVVKPNKFSSITIEEYNWTEELYQYSLA